MANSVIRVWGNTIGTGLDGTADLGNGGSGVHFGDESVDSSVTRSNVIAYNTGDGVTIVGAATNKITVLENSIHSNDGLGIDLGPDGVTANDTDDTDTGPTILPTSRS